MASRRWLVDLGLVILILASAIISGIASSRAPTVDPQVSLGVWKNMPSAQTELMGNTSYRGILETGSSSGESGIFVALSVGCIAPSNTIGAILQLQYANYSRTTHVNITNFVNIGASVAIDNSANNQCPGNLANGGTVLPSINSNPADFIFRVVGQNGGGTGDNPRFSSVSALLFQVARKINSVIIGASTTTTFTFQTQTAFPVTVSTAITFKWQATNITTSGCGILNPMSPTVTDHCWEAGTGSATINVGLTASSTGTITFGTAFTGTVQVVATATGAGAAVTIPTGTISLLLAQTLTV